MEEGEEWENDEIYWKAYEKSVGPMKAALQQMGVEMIPRCSTSPLNIDMTVLISV